MKVRVDLELTEDELRALAGRAYGLGWMREEPRKRWTPSEYKEAARIVVSNLVSEELKKIVR